jgi:hypothetical protein
MDRTKLDPILKKHGLEMVENRYLKGVNYEDGTVSWDSVLESIVFNNSVPEDVLAEIGKFLNPPNVVIRKQKVVKKAFDPRAVSSIQIAPLERGDGMLRGEGVGEV